MSIKKFANPSVFKIMVFLFIGIFYLFLAKESTCAVGLFFNFCYKAYGFPFLYAVTGDINNASDYINTLIFNENFYKLDKFYFNPLTFVLNILLIYLLACFMELLFKHNKHRHF